jgi:predicted P-loop ATPase
MKFENSEQVPPIASPEKLIMLNPLENPVIVKDLTIVNPPADSDSQSTKYARLLKFAPKAQTETSGPVKISIEECLVLQDVQSVISSATASERGIVIARGEIDDPERNLNQFNAALPEIWKVAVSKGLANFEQIAEIAPEILRIAYYSVSTRANFDFVVANWKKATKGAIPASVFDDIRKNLQREERLEAKAEVKIQIAESAKERLQTFDLSAKPAITDLMEGNVAILLDYMHDAGFAEKMAFNQLTQQFEIDDKTIDLETLPLFAAHVFGIKVTHSDAAQVFRVLGKKNSYHPAKVWLESLYEKYDDSEISRLDSIASTYMQTEGNRPIYDTYMKKFLVNAVKRVFEPGCECPSVPILKGRQGCGKSAFVRELFSKQWFDDNLGTDIDSPDEIIKMHMAWGIEISELDRITSKKEKGALKLFITRTTDRIRLPYGRTTEIYPRSSVMIATSNTQDLFEDDEHRRWWPILLTGEVDWRAVGRDRELIWAAAVALYKAGYDTALSPEEKLESAQLCRDFERRDVWTDKIAEWVATPSNTRTRANPDMMDYVTISEILTGAIELPLAKQSRQEQMRVASTLRYLGWEATANAVRLSGLKEPTRAFFKRVHVEEKAPPPSQFSPKPGDLVEVISGGENPVWLKAMVTSTDDNGYFNIHIEGQGFTEPWTGRVELPQLRQASLR